MTTISDNKAEKCLNDWIQYMVETNNLSFEVVRKLKNGKAFRVKIEEINSSQV